MSDQAIILADQPKLPVFQIAPHALALRDEALANSALIARVTNADQNKQAVDAHIFLKRVASTFESARKKMKEPLLDAGRQLDRSVASELIEVEKEIGRLSVLSADFQRAEARRVREEQELQARELARIEAEKQAEIQRIAREQAQYERKAREAAEAAARQAAEATNAKQRAAAEAARVEAEHSAAEAAAKAAAAIQQANERAAEAAEAEAKPITATRVAGQVVKTDWEITVTNPYELAKFHPDCVKIEPLLTPIKQALNAGISVKGISATKVIKSSVRAGTAPLIEV